MFRVGIGWDQHRMAAGRALILGGERFEHPKGLHGHSDADVLTHAVCDAILGALGLGDLGGRFSDQDERHRGAHSLDLLADIASEMSSRGFQVGNLDTVIVAQEPRLGSRLPAMRQNLARVLGCDEARVNVKAASPEGLGALGQAEGMAAHAVVLLQADGKAAAEGP
jgi:2-C-methyl-D-erythritol 2,4-cyclodiphosphate synthase